MYHIVWIPKYRRGLLVNGVDVYCEKILRSFVQDQYPDIWIEELSIQKDHIHLVATIPPKYAVSTVIGRMKQYTSSMLRAQFEYLTKYRDGMWSIGYFVSSVGLNEEMIRKYVQHQDEQDKGQAVSL
jgi:putative transposase